MLSYNKVVAIGDRHVAQLLEGRVDVEEKLDGSQFRIMVDDQGNVSCGSKGVEFNSYGIDKMFKKGVEAMTEVFKDFITAPGTKLHIFAEYLETPRQNTLSYERIPNKHVMIFDVARQREDGSLTWMNRTGKQDFASNLGLEVVPLLWQGNGQDLNNDKILDILKSKSVLGNELIEGVVIKNYEKFYDPVKFPYLMGHFLCGKFVRSEFKERNSTEWAAKKGSIEQLLATVKTEARFIKAIQHCRERGELQQSMKDVAVLMPELIRDFETEEKENMKDALWALYRKQLMGAVGRGFPEFYKQKLLEGQFDKDKERLEEFNAPAVEQTVAESTS